MTHITTPHRNCWAPWDQFSRHHARLTVMPGSHLRYEVSQPCSTQSQHKHLPGWPKHFKNQAWGCNQSANKQYIGSQTNLAGHSNRQYGFTVCFIRMWCVQIMVLTMINMICIQLWDRRCCEHKTTDCVPMRCWICFPWDPIEWRFPPTLRYRCYLLKGKEYVRSQLVRSLRTPVKESQKIHQT